MTPSVKKIDGKLYQLSATRVTKLTSQTKGSTSRRQTQTAEALTALKGVQ